jgi:hypothetical protein
LKLSLEWSIQRTPKNPPILVLITHHCNFHRILIPEFWNEHYYKSSLYLFGKKLANYFILRSFRLFVFQFFDVLWLVIVSTNIYNNWWHLYKRNCLNCSKLTNNCFKILKIVLKMWWKFLQIDCSESLLPCLWGIQNLGEL